MGWQGAHVPNSAIEVRYLPRDPRIHALLPKKSHGCAVSCVVFFLIFGLIPIGFIAGWVIATCTFSPLFLALFLAAPVCVLVRQFRADPVDFNGMITELDHMEVGALPQVPLRASAAYP